MPPADTADEILFGRAGYIYSLLFAERHTAFKIPPETLQFVAHHLIQSGLRGRQFGWPLMWYCFNEPYLGAAHGVAGILYMLLHVWHVLTVEQQSLVRACCFQALALEAEANYPAVLGERAKVCVACN